MSAFRLTQIIFVGAVVAVGAGILLSDGGAPSSSGENARKAQERRAVHACHDAARSAANHPAEAKIRRTSASVTTGEPKMFEVIVSMESKNAFGVRGYYTAVCSFDNRTMRMTDFFTSES